MSVHEVQCTKTRCSGAFIHLPFFPFVYLTNTMVFNKCINTKKVRMFESLLEVHITVDFQAMGTTKKKINSLQNPFLQKGVDTSGQECIRGITYPIQLMRYLASPQHDEGKSGLHCLQGMTMLDLFSVHFFSPCFFQVLCWRLAVLWFGHRMLWKLPFVPHHH